MRAVAPRQVKSVVCGNPGPDLRRPRARIVQRFCVVTVPSAADQTCIVTVAVRAKSRPRRVSARVTIPLTCFRLQELDATG